MAELGASLLSSSEGRGGFHALWLIVQAGSKSRRRVNRKEEGRLEWKGDERRRENDQNTLIHYVHGKTDQSLKKEAQGNVWLRGRLEVSLG